MFLIVGILGAIIVLVFLITDARTSGNLSLGKSAKGAKPVYRSKQKLFSPAEASFFGALKQAFSDDFHIFSKVRMTDVVEPDVTNVMGLGWQGAFNRISSTHLDYVICQTGSWDIIAVIELDDASDDRSDRAARDAFLDASLQEAGVPLVRIKAKATYSVAELRNEIEQARRRFRNPRHPLEVEIEEAALAC